MGRWTSINCNRLPPTSRRKCPARTFVVELAAVRVCWWVDWCRETATTSTKSRCQRPARYMQCRAEVMQPLLSIPEVPSQVPSPPPSPDEQAVA